MLHYLNNAGAGLMSDKTLSVVNQYLQLEREVGPYRAAQQSKSRYEAFYSRAAQLVGAADASEIAFMDNASRAWNMALHGLELREGDTVVTLATEFGTNLVTLFDYAQRAGAKVSVIPCDEAGEFETDLVEKELKKGARLLALSHAAAHASIINPVYELGALAKQYGALYFVDGCQAVGQLSIDVQKIRCDVYTATGRKWLRGPRGTGFLYVKASAPLRASQIDLAAADLEFGTDRSVVGVSVRNDARQFELWERSVAGMFGLSTAIGEYLDLDKHMVATRIKRHADRLRSVTQENTAIRLLGSLSSDSGVVGFYLDDPTMEKAVSDRFIAAQVGISTMHDWDCPLHFPTNGAEVIFRLSPHYDTPNESISAAIDLLTTIGKQD